MSPSMDSTDPRTFNHKCAKLSTGRVYHYVDQIPNGYDSTTSPTILCIHGFPDFWYGWRYQIRPWVFAGYRVIAPDMLGYGETDRPTDASEYSTKKLCDDLAALLDETHGSAKDGKVIVVGHDWGAYVAGRFALWHSERLAALILLSVPYTPPTRTYIPLEEVAKLVPNYSYQLYFADPKSVPKIESDLTKFLSRIFASPKTDKSVAFHKEIQSVVGGHHESGQQNVLSCEDQQIYEQVFRSKGMDGPLSYYRTSKYRYDEEQAANLPANLRPDLPVLFMWGNKDPTAVPTAIGKAAEFIPRLENVELDGVGHWVTIEAKDTVTSKVLEWLESACRTSTARL